MVNKTLSQMLLLCLTALVPAVAAALFHPKCPSWNEDVPREGHVLLADALNLGDQVLWLDARSQEEYEQGHIPDAMLLNEDDWDNLFFEVMAMWQPGRKLVVYCDSKVCQASEHVAERLAEESDVAVDVQVLHGGWESWQAYQQRLNSLMD